MLSEIGTARAVGPMAALLAEEELREDARCALTRHPARGAVTALKSAFATASGDFKYALAESLRQRGAVVEGCPSRKLVPTAQTNVALPSSRLAWAAKADGSPRRTSEIVRAGRA